jgi:hypothetical protein
LILEKFSENLEVQVLFDNLHDKSKQTPESIHQSYFQKQFLENQKLYDVKVLKCEKRLHLGKRYSKLFRHIYFILYDQIYC